MQIINADNQRAKAKARGLFHVHVDKRGIIGLFVYCKGGTSRMLDLDWSTLDIGKS